MTGERTVEHGLYFEDFDEGRVFEHHWGRTFTANDGVTYATMLGHYQPQYFNEPYARSIGYDGMPVPPLLVFTTALGLSVEDLSEAGGPFLGVDDLDFLQPVYPGDTIKSSSVVINRRASASRLGWGIVEWETGAHNQHAALVLRFRRRNLSRFRSDLAAGAST